MAVALIQAASELQYAGYAVSNYRFCTSRFDVVQLSLQDRFGQLRITKHDMTTKSAASVRIGHFYNLKAFPLQQLPGLTIDTDAAL
jgi:hypothetical protein